MQPSVQNAAWITVWPAAGGCCHFARVLRHPRSPRTSRRRLSMSVQDPFDRDIERMPLPFRISQVPLCPWDGIVIVDENGFLLQFFFVTCYNCCNTYNTRVYKSWYIYLARNKFCSFGESFLSVTSYAFLRSLTCVSYRLGPNFYGSINFKLMELTFENYCAYLKDNVPL